MGIIRLTKCLRQLDAIEEYESRESDIKNKINGNYVYLDFVSIVYKIQEKVGKEINYILFSLLLIKNKLINNIELESIMLKKMINKYNYLLDENNSIIDILENNFLPYENKIDKLNSIINDEYIKKYTKTLEMNIERINIYVYNDILSFVTDILTEKLINVESVTISFDGIPSFGKIQEQRQRRYMRYAFLEFKKHIQNETLQKNTNQNKLIEIRLEYDKIAYYIDIKSAIEYVYNQYDNNKLQQDISDFYILKKNNLSAVGILEKNNISIAESAL